MNALRILMLLILLFFEMETKAQKKEGQPLNIGITEQFESKILNEPRTVNIYFPEDFNANDSIMYPVIYIPDGGIEEDFFHIAGIVQFNTQPWVALFQKSIVVGIENTNRKRDFTFAVTNLDFLEKAGYKKDDIPEYGNSKNYISFLEKELLPYIQKKYKAGNQRTIVGESLAGLLATEILFEHTHLFNTYIIVSPSLWWGNERLLKKENSLINFTTNIKVYVGAPDKNENKMMYEEAETLFKIVSRKQNATAVFDHIGDETHSTVFHQAVYNAFKKLYQNNKKN